MWAVAWRGQPPLAVGLPPVGPRPTREWCPHKEPAPKLTLHAKSEKNTPLPPYHVPILFSSLMEFFPAGQKRPKVENSVTGSQVSSKVEEDNFDQDASDIWYGILVKIMEVHNFKCLAKFFGHFIFRQQCKLTFAFYLLSHCLWSIPFNFCGRCNFDRHMSAAGADTLYFVRLTDRSVHIMCACMGTDW